MPLPACTRVVDARVRAKLLLAAGQDLVDVIEEALCELLIHP